MDIKREECRTNNNLSIELSGSERINKPTINKFNKEPQPTPAA